MEPTDPVPTTIPPQPPAAEPASAMIPAGWCGVSLLGTCLIGALVGWAGYNSESAGSSAAMFGSLPVGFLLGGAVAAVVIHLAMPRATQPVRLGAPVACGCLGGIGLAFAVFVFFAFIFPAL